MRDIEMVDLMFALAELSAFVDRPAEELTAEELKQVSFAGFAFVQAVIQEKTRRESL